MLRRRVTIALHWIVFLLMVLLVSGGLRYPALVWAFVAFGFAFSALGLTRGLMTRPGPKLQGMARFAHPWSHRVMYVLAGGCAFVVLMATIGRPLTWLGASMALMLLLSASSLHAIFHLWRHTALNDGALRIMTPRRFHGIL